MNNLDLTDVIFYVTSGHSVFHAHLLALKSAHFGQKCPLMGDKEVKRERGVTFASFGMENLERRRKKKQRKKRKGKKESKKEEKGRTGDKPRE